MANLAMGASIIQEAVRGSHLAEMSETQATAFFMDGIQSLNHSQIGRGGFH